MKLTFFGGANEVGASSTLIEIDEYRILVDAGIRMNHEYGNDSPLPDFSAFDKVGMPHVVLLTHAHTDHTGAFLPDLHKRLPADVKVYCTEATKAITEVLLKDSIKIMQREEEQTGKAPHTLDDVTAVLKRMETVSWSDPVDICPGVTARWIPAGHILGAAMIYIEGKSETLLMTGDVSVPRQLTIPGLDLPLWCKNPDAMVMEATYGNRLHEGSRRQAERKLAEDVAKVIAAGGKVLIPAFAVGRSQEVILILKGAMERKEIPEFPVYVDGMVRDVNSIYSQFSDELQRRLRREAKQGEPLFYCNMIKKVESPDERERILAGEPCCIVASSGMLIGGMSSEYAKYLAPDPKNLIAITGYQAEGTPGRALLDLSAAGESTDPVWKLKDDESVLVKCQVKRYSLSAHADSHELLALVEEVQPRKLFLVHGDAEARGELFKSVCKACPAVDAKLPENGKLYRVKRRSGIARGRRHTIERVLSEVHTHLLKREKKKAFRVRELAEIWFGSDAITPIAVEFFKLCLSLDGRFFERRPDDLFYLRHV